MYPYSMLQWLFFFYTYCFIGWCWETLYVSVKTRKLVNRGFMHGPFLPIYGTGAIMMLVVSAPFQDNLILTYLAGMAGATVLELITGTLMELLFKVRYWDYSKQRFNYKGYICLSSSVAWGFFTIVMTKFMHNPIEHLVMRFSARAVSWAAVILTCYLAVDFAVSFRGALNLRALLDKMEQAKAELALMERRLDAMIAFSTGEFAQEKPDSSRKMKLVDLKKRVDDRLDSVKQSVRGGASNLQEEIEQYRTRLQELLDGQGNNFWTKRKEQRGRIFRNPTMVSKRYQQSLNELKQMMSDFRNKKK